MPYLAAAGWSTVGWLWAGSGPALGLALFGGGGASVSLVSPVRVFIIASPMTFFMLSSPSSYLVGKVEAVTGVDLLAYWPAASSLWDSGGAMRVCTQRVHTHALPRACFRASAPGVASVGTGRFLGLASNIPPASLAPLAGRPLCSS